VDESVHRPARLRGGATGEPLAAAPALAGLLGEPLSHVKRSLPLQAASSAVQARIESAAMRVAMDAGRELKGTTALFTRMPPLCQGAVAGSLRRRVNAAEVANQGSTASRPRPR
jgi:hypothetical protein